MSIVTPWPLFAQWLEEAIPTEPRVPEAMQLATVSANGTPSLRTVLLKDHGEHGLVFYTNLGSRKASELTENPRCSFLFHYKGLERQVLGTGSVQPVDAAVADAYFASRPRGSQIGAWASRQSQTIPGHAYLAERVADLTARFEGQDVPRPDFWSGFRIVPAEIEFWQGREDRLHERRVFTREGDSWTTAVLSP